MRRSGRARVSQAGGRNDANNTPWIVAYMTEKVTILFPKSRRLPSAPSSSRHPATHQYHTAYPDAILVMICT